MPINLAEERARQAASRAFERLHEDGFVPDAVERSMALIESSLPILDTEVCEALMHAGLCFKRLSCEALLTAARCFRTEAPFAIVRLGPSAALVKAETTEALNQLAARVRDLIHSHGCANTTELIDEARAIFGPNASLRFAEAALRSARPFEWLDPDAKWFWYIGEDPAGSNRLVHQIQRVLAATPRIQLTALRSAIRRDNGFGGFAPPNKVLEFICRHLLFVRLEGDAIARVPGILKLDQALTSDEKILIDVLQSHGPVLKREPFLEHCRKLGLDETKFNRMTSDSLILDAHDGIGYTIVGATLPTADAQNVDRKPGDHGFLSEGLLFLAWKLSATAIQGGVLRVPEPMNTFVEGDYQLKTLVNSELGSLHIRQRACWDVRRLLTTSGGNVEDTLVLVFDLHDHTATGIIGDDDVVTRLASGWPA